jgi:hypothetical protein
VLKGASVCIRVGIEDDENVCWDVPRLGRLYEIGDWANSFLLAYAGVTFHGKVDHAELWEFVRKMTGKRKR